MNQVIVFCRKYKEQNDTEDDECALIERKIGSWTDGLHALTWRNLQDGPHYDPHLNQLKNGQLRRGETGWWKN